MTSWVAWRYNVTGRRLFTASAAFLTYAAVRVDDWINLALSQLFLIAGIIFLVPVWRLCPPG